MNARSKVATCSFIVVMGCWVFGKSHTVNTNRKAQKWQLDFMQIATALADSSDSYHATNGMLELVAEVAHAGENHG
jgi:succinate dehydrogenase hydrophobic anchor subunit